jgi:hypothetical protein
VMNKVVDVEERSRLKEDQCQCVEEPCDEELQRKIIEIIKRLEKRITALKMLRTKFSLLKQPYRHWCTRDS